MKKSFQLFCSALVLLQLAGCMAITGKRFGACIDDTVICTSLKGKYLFNNDVHSFWININSHNGDVVLVGSVQNKEEEDIAIRLAKSVEGVHSVTSFLKIKDIERQQTQVKETAYNQE